MPLVLHPDSWRERPVVFPSGTELFMPPPSRADLEAEGVQVVEERGPSLLLDGAVLAELAAIAPDWVVPGHCTGWRATHELARALPDAYIQTSVGTTLHFEAS